MLTPAQKLGITDKRFVCLLFLFGLYEYKAINERNNFTISQINWNGETKLWTDNTKNNIYDIKFKVFDGTDLKEINSQKSTYEMKIDSTVDNGELGIKIYTDKKVLLDTNGSTNKKISVSEDDSPNIKRYAKTVIFSYLFCYKSKLITI